MIRVLVVAEYPLARSGLTTLLGGWDDLSVFGQTAADGALGALTGERVPDVVLLDLPARDEEAALEGVERLVAARPGLAVVVLGTDGAGDGPADALTAGAQAYLPHEVGANELVAAVRAVAAGLVVLHPNSTAPLLERANGRLPVPRPVRATGGEPLTPRELEVVQGLADGLTNRAIARRLGVSENTVKFHVSSILTKLDVTSRPKRSQMDRSARRGSGGRPS